MTATSASARLCACGDPENRHRGYGARRCTHQHCTCPGWRPVVGQPAGSPAATAPPPAPPAQPEPDPEPDPEPKPRPARTGPRFRTAATRPPAPPPAADLRPASQPPVPPTGRPDRLLTPREVADLFRVDPKTVTRWANAGLLHSIRTLGGHRRFREAVVRQHLDGQG